MKTLVTVLLVLFGALILLLLSVLLYHPKEKTEEIPQVSRNESLENTESIPVVEDPIADLLNFEEEEEEENDPVSSSYAYRWKSLMPLMKEEKVKGASAYVFSEAKSLSEYLFLLFKDEMSFSCCMEALERMVDAHEMSDKGLFIVKMKDGYEDTDSVVDQCLTLMKEKGYQGSRALVSSSGLKKEEDGKTMANLSMAVYDSGELKSSMKESIALSPSGILTLEGLKDEISFTAYMMRKLFPSFAVKEAVNKHPSLKNVFYSHEEDGKIYCLSSKQLEEYSAANQKAGFDGTARHSRIYQRTVNALKESMDLSVIASVHMKEEDFVLIPGFETMMFGPLYEDESISVTAAISFYRHFLHDSI